MKKVFLFIFSLFVSHQISAQVSNDDCVNAAQITLDANGNACVTGTTANALGVTFTSHPCWPTLQNIPEVWYTFVTSGTDNTITVTPTGGTPAQQLGVTVMSGSCASILNNCGLSATNGGAAISNWNYGVGTQVWINVGSMVSQGGFQICISSNTPPPNPGGSCATATTLCNKNPFSVTTFPNNSNGLQPSCFPTTFQRPVFYKFTVGTSGTCGWAANPTGPAEFDWVMYDITGGCPNNVSPTFNCNFNFDSQNGSPVGMQAGAPANCPNDGLTTSGAANEFCPLQNVVAGNTYMIIIDNWTDDPTGFDFSFSGNFTIAPNPVFTMSANTSCSPPLNVSFTNSSTTCVSQTWNFGNGNTSTAVTPPAQTYTATGTYLVSLTGTSATGCQDVYTQNISIGTPPTVTVPTNTTVCAGATIPAAAFTTTPSGGILSWTNSNTAIGLAASGSANIPAFTATNATTSPITATITVTPTLNGCVGVPSSYTITVNPTPVLTAVTSQTVCANANTTAITYTVNPAASVINWTNSNAAIGLTTAGVGDIASFTGTNAGSTAISGNFVATPDFNGCIGTPRNFTVTVNPIPTLASVASQTVCAGANTTAITFNPTPAAPATTINWTNSNNTIGLGASGSGNIAAFAGINAGSTAEIGNFVATPVASGCTGTAQNFTITINPTPTLAAISSQTVCATANTTAITFNPTPSAPTTTINWTNSNGTIGIGTTGTGDIAAFAGVNAGSTAAIGNFAATPVANGCTGTAQNFTITINPIPTLAAVASQTVCTGANTTAITFNPTPTAPTTTINWTNSNNTIGIGASGSGNIAAFAGINASSTPAVGNFVATPVANGCTGTAQNFTITVNPTPTLAAVASQTVCATANTTAITFNPTPAAPTTTINWTNSNGTIGIGTTGTGDIAAFAGVNAGSTPAVGNFVATPVASGCTGTAQNFTITINPTPTLAAVTSQTVCANANTTAITFNPTPAAPTTTINWTNSNSSIGIGTTGAGDIAAFAGVNAGSTPAIGNFVATPVANGCTGTAQNFTITINPLPTLTPVASQTICPGSNTTAITFVSNPVGATVGWTNSDPTIGIGANGIGNIAAFTGVNAGASNLTGNFVAIPTLNTCIGASQNFSITVSQLPVATAGSNSPVCVNGTLNLTSGGGTIYSWQGPNSFASNSQNPSLANASIPMAGIYTVTVGVGGTCQSTTTVTVVINPLPIVNIGSNSPVCENGTINLTSGGGVSYSWLGPIGFSSNIQNPSLTPATLSMAGNYTVTVTDGNNCVNANVTTVVVNPEPIAPVTAPVTYCQNDAPASLTAGAVAGGALNWYDINPTGGVASAIAPIPSTASAVNTTYYVSQTLLNCEGPRASLLVTVNPLPTATLNNVSSGCVPVCSDFTLNPSTTITSYVWNLGNTTNTTTASTVNNCYNDPGTYSISVTLTDNLGCVSNLSFPNWISAYANPIANFTYSPQPVTILEPSVTFVDQSIGANITSYNWNFGDALISTASGQVVDFTYSSTGVYMVQLAIMTSNGCVDTIYKPLEVLEDFVVYIPNTFSPNGDDINEEFYPLGIGISDDKYSLLIFDRWGELIFSSTKYDQHWDGKKMGHNDVVQQDTYIYKLSCRNFKGNKFSKSGHVNVIR